MMQDEINKILANAILQLAEKSASTWDFDGEQMIGEGVDLDEFFSLQKVAGKEGEGL